MKARTSRRIARVTRHTKKSANLAMTTAKTTRSVGKLGISSGVFLAHRGPMMAAAIASPATLSTTEIQRTGSEKAPAAFSAAVGIFPNLMSAQLAWVKFGLTQARLSGMAFEALRATPLIAGRTVAEVAERTLANAMDAAMSFSRMGQLAWQQALRPFQKAVSANVERLAKRIK